MNRMNLSLSAILIWSGTSWGAAAQAVEQHSGATDHVSLRQVLSSGATMGGNQGAILMATLGQPIVGSRSAGGSLLNQGFWLNSGIVSCCTDRVGDANGNGEDEPQISDIAIIIDFLFISRNELWCYSEADANQSGGENPNPEDITIGDVTVLIDYLFITGSSLGLAPCL